VSSPRRTSWPRSRPRSGPSGRLASSEAAGACSDWAPPRVEHRNVTSRESLENLRLAYTGDGRKRPETSQEPERRKSQISHERSALDQKLCAASPPPFGRRLDLAGPLRMAVAGACGRRAARRPQAGGGQPPGAAPGRRGRTGPERLLTKAMAATD